MSAPYASPGAHSASRGRSPVQVSLRRHPTSVLVNMPTPTHLFDPFRSLLQAPASDTAATAAAYDRASASFRQAEASYRHAQALGANASLSTPATATTAETTLANTTGGQTHSAAAGVAASSVSTGAGAGAGVGARSGGGGASKGTSLLELAELENLY